MDTVDESCYNDDPNDKNCAAASTIDSISHSERHKTWQKRKRQGTTERAKERRVAEWSALSEEQQEERKRKRKENLEIMDQKLLNALENGLNVCVDLSFDSANVSDKVMDMLIIYYYIISYTNTLPFTILCFVTRSVRVSANNCHYPGVC